MRAISPDGGRLFSVKVVPSDVWLEALTFRGASVHSNMSTSFHRVVDDPSPVVRLLLQTFEFFLISLLPEVLIDHLSFVFHGILRSS